jgi:hypothetical protein
MKRRRPKWRLGVLLASVAIAAVAPVATLLSAPSPVVPRGRVAGVARDGLLPARTPYPELLPCGDILVPIDKQHELPADCVPADLVEVDGTGLYLRAKATAAFRELAAAANRDGYSIGLSSAYRSYETQEATFAWWVGLYGLDQAERTSAHAGQSPSVPRLKRRGWRRTARSSASSSATPRRKKRSPASPAKPGTCAMWPSTLPRSSGRAA